MERKVPPVIRVYSKEKLAKLLEEFEKEKALEEKKYEKKVIKTDFDYYIKLINYGIK